MICYLCVTLLISMYIINNMRMLYFDRIDFSEGSDVNKISTSKKGDICQYLYFLNKGLSFNQMSAIDEMIY